MLKLECNEKVQELVPGQRITARAGWQMNERPKKAVLRLFWYTEGRGTQDVGIVEEKEFPSPGLSHNESFNFTLPNEPYSFSGKLISLRWALELVLNKGKEVERIDLIMSPWVEHVTLKAVSKQDQYSWDETKSDDFNDGFNDEDSW